MVNASMAAQSQIFIREMSSGLLAPKMRLSASFLAGGFLVITFCQYN